MHPPPSIYRSITFRELNRMLRRTRRTDAESKQRRSSPGREGAIHTVDVRALRKQVSDLPRSPITSLCACI